MIKNISISEFKTQFIAFFFTVILFIPLLNQAQNRDFVFKDPKLSLSDNGVRCIMEDSKGFMWFGAESGLNRYDGNNVRIYTKDPKDSSSLSNNSIYAIYKDANNNLWIGTGFGLNLYDRSRDCFQQFYFDRSDPECDNMNFIRGIVEDADGDLWLATLGGVCLLDRSSKKIVDFAAYTNSQPLKHSFMVRSLIASKDSRIFAGCNEGFLVELDKHKGEVKLHYFDNGSAENVLDVIVNNIHYIEGEGLWVGSIDQGLFKINEIKDGHVWYEQFKHAAHDDTSVGSDFILGVSAYDKGKILVATENGGLNLMNTETKVFKQFVSGQEIENSIGGNSIWSVYKDSRGLIWLGIFNVGINIIDRFPPKFKSIKNLVYKNESLMNGAITSFVADELGNMWITSDGGGLDYWDRTSNIFHHYKHNEKVANCISSNAALCLFMPSEKELWIGTYAGGISILDIETKTFSYITKKEGLSSNNVFDIFKASSGKIYIATHGGGLDEFNPKTKTLRSFLNDSLTNSTIHDIYINTLYQDRKANLWVGLNIAGLKLMKDKPSGLTEVKSFVNKEHVEGSISNNSILVIKEDFDGNVWVGTRYGLNKFDYKTEQFTVYTTDDGLPNNTIVGILEDEAHNLWISTLKGLSVFNPKTRAFKNYNESDGIHGLVFSNRTACYKNKQGELFFGGNDGFTMVKPQEIQYDSTFPEVCFVGLKLFNKEVSLDDEDTPLSKNITASERIIFNHKQSVFTIEFAALNFSAPEKISYAYWLEGVDKDWNYVGSKRSATYTSLHKGRYIFHVKTTNTEGDWNDKEYTLEIVVLPPWWKETWFILLFLVLLFVGLYLIYIQKLHYFKIQNEELEIKVMERTRALSQSNAQLQEINQEVNQQKEELQTQSEVLTKTNRKLEESRKELYNHKENLEQLIKIRTQELEKSRDKAEESDRLKTSFLANMSHEIRTPMNAIVGFSNLLNKPNLLDNIKENYIAQINANAKSLLLLIDDVLDLAMMESNMLTLKTKEFALNQLMIDVLASVPIQSEGVMLKLNNKLKVQQSVLFSDPDRIKQILLNLLKNAKKFTEHGSIEFGCDIQGDYLVFFVKDTGIGISKENLNIIFNRFRKVSDNKTKLFRGAGLGLAISKRIADQLGGDLLVESQLGVGSTFILQLPLDIVLGSSSSIANKKIKGTNWEGKSILIVEDEEANFAYLESALKITNVNIVWAKNGLEAIALFRESEFNCILMDIKMPQTNGYEATKAIKALDSEQIVIVQTAYTSAEDHLKMEQAGFDDYLIKPIMPDSLVSIVGKYM